MEPVEWIVVGVVVFILLLAIFAKKISRWIFGGTGPKPNVTLAFGQSPRRGPAPPSGTKFVVKLTRSDGNPVPVQNCTFTIFPGDDGIITSAISGSSVVATDQNGQASVTVVGNDDGADIIQVTVGIGSAEINYETLKNDP
jgi:hypothetical protein